MAPQRWTLQRAADPCDFPGPGKRIAGSGPGIGTGQARPQASSALRTGCSHGPNVAAILTEVAIPTQPSPAPAQVATVDCADASGPTLSPRVAAKTRHQPMPGRRSARSATRFGPTGAPAMRPHDHRSRTEGGARSCGLACRIRAPVSAVWSHPTQPTDRLRQLRVRKDVYGDRDAPEYAGYDANRMSHARTGRRCLPADPVRRPGPATVTPQRSPTCRLRDCTYRRPVAGRRR